MGNWRSRNPLNSNSAKRKARKARERRLDRHEKRGGKGTFSLERFEERCLLAGPQLISIIPNAGDLIQDGQTRNVAPRELTFRFDQNQVIDDVSLAAGIRFVRAGADGLLGTADDLNVALGFQGIGKRPSEVVVRFAETLVDDAYRIVLVGAGAAPLRNTDFEAFNNGVDKQIDFNLDLGAQVIAVVPQPVQRDALGNLTQAGNRIEVYFNDDDLRTIAAGQLDPNFFQLIYTANTATPNDDAPAVTPSVVSYDAAADKAVLTFAQDLSSYGTGSFRLRIGNDDAPLPAPVPVVLANDPGSTFAGSRDLGVLTSQSQIVSQSIDVTPIGPGLIYPGGENELGHRDIPVAGEDHLANKNPSGGGGVPVRFYNFQDVYGFTPENDPLLNVITETQKQRTREIFDLIARYAGVQFVETTLSGVDVLTIATGDPRAVDPTVPTGVTGIPGIAGASRRRDGVEIGPTAVINAGFNWGDSEYGGGWFKVAMHEVLHLLGAGHAYDLPSLTIQGNEGEFGIGGYGTGEPVFPGDADILHTQFLYRTEGNDIDLYTFVVDRAGSFSAETVAERRNNSSLLDSALTLYNEVNTLQVPANGGAGIVDGQRFVLDDGAVSKTFEFDGFGGVAFGNIAIPYVRTGANTSTPRDLTKAISDAVNAAGMNVKAEFSLDKVTLQGPITVDVSQATSLVRRVERQIVSRNDDYFSKDAFVQMQVTPGRYYLAVTSTGNTTFDPNLANSGQGGRTVGGYDLRVNFKPAPDLANALQNQLDATGTAIDGNDDGVPGGVDNFWFNVGPTLFVDKSAAGGGDGSLATPFHDIQEALKVAGNRIIAPTAGVAAISDGQTFIVNDGVNSPFVFEFDLDSLVIDSNHVRVALTAGDITAESVAARIVEAINSTGLLFAVQNLSDPTFVDVQGDLSIDLRGTPALIDAVRIVRILGNSSGDNSLEVRPTTGIGDGQTFRLAVGPFSLTFEFNSAGGVASGNVPVNVAANASASAVAAAMVSAINGSALGGVGAGRLTAAVPPGTTRVDLTSVDVVTIDAKGAPSLMAVSNAVPYEIGVDSFEAPLADGITMNVPQAVTVMIDAGAVFKLRGANIDAGSSAQNIDRSRGAIQVLGTPTQSVYFTSFDDEAIGQDTNPLATQPARGQWGGLTFRDDSDLEAQGIFLNYVNHADIRYGGGQVDVNSVRSVFNPIHLVTARPTLTYNTITESADAAISADPNAFQDTKFTDNLPGTAYTADYDRVGPHIHGNRLSELRNDFNVGTFLQAPDANQLQDGQTFSINGRRFEVNFFGGVLAGNVAINVAFGGTAPDVADAIAAAVNGANIGSPRVQATVVGDRVFLANVRSLSPSALTIPAGTDLRDGQIFTVNGRTFEFDSNLQVASGHVAVVFAPADAATTVAQAVTDAINAARIGVFAAATADRVVLMNATQVSAPTPLRVSLLSPLVMNVVGGGQLVDGQTFTVNGVVFEMDSVGGVAAGRVQVRFRTQDSANTVATAIAAAINGSTSGARARAFGPVVSINNADTLLIEVPVVNGTPTPNLTYGTNALAIGLIDAASLVHDNTINGLFVRIRTLAGQPVDTLDVASRFDDTDIVHVIAQNLNIRGTPGGPVQDPISGEYRARLDGRLQIDPSIVVKMQGARIDSSFGGQLIAEAQAGSEVIFTSIHDGRYGGGGTFDTDGDDRSITPAPSAAAPGDWAGLFFGPGARGSLDHALVTFGGGNTTIEGGFDKFNAVEIHQADVRITDSTLEKNASGKSDTSRHGRGANESSVIFIRGAQPIIVNDVIRDNLGDAINANANAYRAFLNGDWGRSTGALQAYSQFDDNRGPLVRLNRLGNNPINGMAVRGGTLTTQTVWDDTDIVHVVRDDVVAPNFHTYGGLRIQSSLTESLVVKLFGATAGITASGTPLDIDDRLGGSVQIVGTAGHAVVLTTLSDNTVGAGLTPDGEPQNATDNGVGTGPAGGGSGPVMIDGGDRDDHGQFNATTGLNEDGWKFIEQAINFAYSTSRNTAGVGILVIGATAGSASDAVNSATTVLGLPAATFIAGAQISTENFGNYRMLYVPSDDNNVSGGISDADLDLLTQRKIEVQDFVNFTGGGLIAFTEGAATLPFAWLELPDPFSIVVYGAGGNTDNLTQTPALAAAGFNITDAELNNGTPWHNSFSGPPGFNNLEPWVVSDVTGEVVTLGLPAGSSGIGGTAGAPGDWRSIRFNEDSNDRNVDSINETESPFTGGNGVNDIPDSAQFLGELAPDEKSGDDKRRLGFQVQGFVSLDSPRDVDVYSFRARTGTEAWFDIDRTNAALDTVIEVVDATGAVLARSDNSATETAAVDPTTPGANPVLSGLLSGNLGRAMQRDTLLGKTYGGNELRDYYTTNPLDSGLRMTLPGKANTVNTYYVRVRSRGADLNNAAGGQTKGEYQLQVRLRELDEVPGSTVRLSDVRFATNGIEVLGLPGHSPLLGESADEPNDLANEGAGAAQDIGNPMTVDRGTISVGGSLATPTDVDWYKFTVDYDLIQVLQGVNDSGKSWSTVFDIDYADGIARPDTTLALFDQNLNLILVSRDSNVADDQPRPTFGADTSNLAGGSFGKLDPYVGSVQLPEGANRTYFVAIASNAVLPAAMDGTFRAAATNRLLRLEPVSSLDRIVEDHIGFTGYTTGDLDNLNKTAANDPVANAGDPKPLPRTAPGLLDISTAQTLATHVKPFRLEDVGLYVSTVAAGGASSLLTINPANGQTIVPNITNFIRPVYDLAMRSDGHFFGYRDEFGNNVGERIEIDPGTGAVLDPDISGDEEDDDTIDTDELEGAVPDALAYDRVGPANYTFWYSARHQGSSLENRDMSFLYFAEPTEGETTPTPPFGLWGAMVNKPIIVTIVATDPDDRSLARDINDGTLITVDDGRHAPTVFEWQSGRQITTVDGVFIPHRTQFTLRNSPGHPQEVLFELWNTDVEPLPVPLPNDRVIVPYDNGDNDEDMAQIIADAINAPATGAGALELLVTASNARNRVLVINTFNDFGPDVDGLPHPTGVNPLTYTGTSDFDPAHIPLRFRADDDEFIIARRINAGINGVGASLDSASETTADIDVPPTPYVLIEFSQSLQADRPFRVIGNGPGGPISGLSFLPNQGSAGSTLYGVSQNGGFYRVIDFGISGGANPVSSVVFEPDLADLFENASPFVVVPQIVDPRGGTLFGPSSAIFGPDGNLYVASRDTHQVLRYNARTGEFMDIFVDRGGGDPNKSDRRLYNPEAMVFGPDANNDNVQDLYIANFGFENIFGGVLYSGDVLRFDGATGAYLDTFVVPDFPGSGGLNGATGLVFDSQGRLYVSSYRNDRVLRYDSDGRFLDTFVLPGFQPGRAGLDGPRGITFGPDVNNDGVDDLYVASANNDKVVVVSGASGAFIKDFVKPKAGGVGRPSAIAFGPDGDLFVSSMYNSQLKKYNGTSQRGNAILRFNGFTGAFVDDFTQFASDGQLTDARSIAFDVQGRMYVASYATDQVLRFETDGSLKDAFVRDADDGPLWATQGNRYGGLSAGPQNLDFDADGVGGDLKRILFAIGSGVIDGSTGGKIVAFTERGNPVNVFDYNNDTVLDPYARTNVPDATGLAFSPLDFNLWHPTMNRRGNGGHGINPSFDNSRPDPTQFDRQINDRLSNEGEGGASLYFGLDEWFVDPTDHYLTYGENAQLGLSQATHFDLSSNPEIRQTYNIPGGAYGSMYTNPFSLEGYSYFDKPTLYVNYFLQTENANFNGNQMWDSARIFASQDNGVSWHLVSTNNSILDAELPKFVSQSSIVDVNNPDSRQRVQEMFDTNEWRQARIDLGDFAGRKNLVLRFDFSTAGQVVRDNKADADSRFKDFKNKFGDVGNPRRYQKNKFEGWYIDDIIVGLAERGEMATGAVAGQAAVTFEVPKNPNFNAPKEVLTGAYQLEVRRGEEYTVDEGTAHRNATPIRTETQNANDRLTSGFTLLTPGWYSATREVHPGQSQAPIDFLFDNVPNPGGATATDVVGYIYIETVADLEANDEYIRLDAIGAPSVSRRLFEIGGQQLGLDSVKVPLSLSQLQSMRDANGRITVRLTPSAAVSSVNTLTVRLDFVGQQTTVADGDSFLVSDGVNKAIFEFDRNNSLVNLQPPVGPAPVRAIVVNGKEDAYELSAKIAAAINAANVAGIVKVTAATTREDNLNNPNNSNPNPFATVFGRVDLFGAAAVDTRRAPRLGSAAGFFPEGTVRPFEQRGDRNLPRDQGQVLIQSNKVTNALQAGIVVDAAPRDASGNLPHPGSVRNTTVLNNQQWAPGVTVENNLVVLGAGTDGILVSGDGANAPGAPNGAVSFARVVNNTVYGSARIRGVGIHVTENASPTLMNNIVASLATGVLIDPSSNTTVLGETIYQNNVTNRNIGSVIENFAIELNANDPLFLAPDSGNFYLAAGSRAIDSSLDTLADRAALANVKSPLGIGVSPILAPDRDVFFQLRVDDPLVTPPPGLGANVFKDRGAVERADLAGPTALLLTPRDNDELDQNTTDTVVHLVSQSISEFAISLVDGIGVGIDNLTVDATRFTLRRNGFLLKAGVDYVFSYDNNNKVIRFIATAGVWLNGNAYSIAVDNGVKFDSNLTLVGIRDRAGNLLRPNRADSSTRFDIVLDSFENDPPILSVPGPQTTAEDTPLVFSQANFNPITVFDVDSANLPLEVTLTTAQGVFTLPTTNGLTLVNGEGTGALVFRGPIAALNVAFEGLRFTPTLNYYGPGTIGLLINDLGNTGPGGPKTSAAEIPLTITPVNDPPVVIGGIQDVTVDEDSGPVILDLAGVFDDVDLANGADTLTLSLSGNTNSGLVAASFNGTLLRLLFSQNQNGVSTLTVRATDSAGAFVQRSFRVTVNAVNDPPFVANLIPDVTVDEDAPPSTISLANTFGDVDIATNGDALTLSIVSVSNPGLLTASLTGTQLTLTYLPNANGAATIVVRATDNAGAAVSTSFHVTVRPINDPPVAVADPNYSFEINSTLTVTDPGVVTNDVDVDGDTLTAILFDVPAHGKLQLGANGGFTYVPDLNFRGIDRFSYKVEDGSVRSNSATVTLTSFDYRWVERVYKEIMLRNAGESEVLFWVGNLEKGMSRQQVAEFFVASVERRSRIINQLYNDYLGRNVDGAGLKYWLGVWAANRGPERVQAGIIGTLEYFVRSGATQANPGPWVQALYQNILNRSASASDVAYWVGVLRSTSRETVVYGFVTSDEYRLTVIGGFYSTYLKRTLDAAGGQYWLNQMKNGVTQEQILSGILASDEYRARP